MLRSGIFKRVDSGGTKSLLLQATSILIYLNKTNCTNPLFRIECLRKSIGVRKKINKLFVFLVCYFVNWNERWLVHLREKNLPMTKQKKKKIE